MARDARGLVCRGTKCLPSAVFWRSIWDIFPVWGGVDRALIGVASMLPADRAGIMC